MTEGTSQHKSALSKQVAKLRTVSDRFCIYNAKDDSAQAFRSHSFHLHLGPKPELMGGKIAGQTLTHKAEFGC